MLKQNWRNIRHPPSGLAGEGDPGVRGWKAWPPPPPAASCRTRGPEGPPDPHPPDFMGEKPGNSFLLLGALLCWGFVGDVWGEMSSEFAAEDGSWRSSGCDEVFVAVYPPSQAEADINFNN